MDKIKVAFFGTPEFAVPILQGLIDNYEVLLVVTQPDKKVGRKQIITKSPIKLLAEKHHIKVFSPVKIKEDFAEVITSNVDIIVTCAYGQIIPKEILDYPRLGCINVHASLLPKLRGGAPIHHAIIDGYEETGITIMYMDEKMDSGDIIAQKSFLITDTDNTGIIHDKLMALGKDLLLETLPKIILGTNKKLKQNEKEVTYAYNIKREEEKLDFNKKTKDLINQVRGLYPWPLGYIVIDGVETKVLEAYAEECNEEHEVGSIVAANSEGIVIKTIDGALVVTKIRPAAKKELTIKEYLNGKQIKDLIGKRVI